MKKSFDKRTRVRIFREGDLVLKWDADKAKLGRHSNFDALWSGPYLIVSCKQAKAFQSGRPNGEILPILVNGIYPKDFF